MSSHLGYWSVPAYVRGVLKELGLRPVIKEIANAKIEVFGSVVDNTICIVFPVRAHRAGVPELHKCISNGFHRHAND